MIFWELNNYDGLSEFDSCVIVNDELNIKVLYTNDLPKDTYLNIYVGDKYKDGNKLNFKLNDEVVYRGKVKDGYLKNGGNFLIEESISNIGLIVAICLGGLLLVVSLIIFFKKK